ncbi:MAG: hypothetical protein LQ340_006512 [Diploschistes diacapsis]|nr:MAG: hypothetical protein LQ340_006512 [Diploschistes diacapsis]
MSQNQAAWLVASKKPLEVKSAPYTQPRDGELVIRVKAAAVNPFDWVLRDTGNLPAPWLKTPFILGTDVAGEVVEVGRGTTRFGVGDRVVGHALGADKERNTAAEGGFQLYTVLLEHMTSSIPSSMSFESASVIPLGASTAACGLFEKDQLNLQHPSIKPKPTGKTVLIWGASTSVGCNAVQLAVAAGYDVFATCSPRNFDLIRRLGASRVFDYNSKAVVKDIIEAFKGLECVGALAIGLGSADFCLNILGKVDGAKALSMASYPAPPTEPKNFVMAQMAYYYLAGRAAIAVKARTISIRYAYIYATTLAYNGVGKAVYADFLPMAMEQGSYVAAPDPEVVGTGLESVEEALVRQKKGVSAKKIVVAL